MKKLILLAAIVLLPTLVLAQSQVIVTGRDPAGGSTSQLYPAKVKDNRLQVVTSPDAAAWKINSITTGTTLAEIKAAPGASKYLYITDIVLTSTAASTASADELLQLKTGTGTNCGTGTAVLFSCHNIANGGCSVSFQTPLKVAANTALCFMDAVVGTKSVNVSGYTLP